MPCKAPAFWWKPDASLAARALRPAAAIYRAVAHARHQSADAYVPQIPVICVGNVVAGGAGKTPAVQALTALLFDAGITQYPTILLRGYGGKLSGPTTVDAHFHSYKDVGDEALLHTAAAPTIIARDRAAGVQLAQLSGADCVLMDDGLQNPSVQKSLSFLVFDAAQGIGNGLTLPAGPLRENLADALAKTDAIILLGDDVPFETDKPVFRARILPRAIVSLDKPFIAFAGLGRPEKFRKTLEQVGANLIAFHAFGDHHAYKSSDIEPLIRAADEKGADLITTEKDWVRIPAALQERVQSFPVSLHFDDAPSVVHFVRERLGRS